MRVLSKNINALHASLHGLISEIYKANNNRELNAVLHNIVNERDSHVLIPISVAGETASMRYNADRNFDPNDLTYGIDRKPLLEIDSNYEHMMNFFNAIYSEEDLKIFGVLILFGETRLNPLHPLIAKMISKGQIELPETFKLVVYQLDQEIKTSIEPEHVQMIGKALALSDKEEMVKTSSRFRYSRTDVIRDMDKRILQGTNALTTNYEKTRHGTSTPMHALIPIQKMSTGVTYPYYGMVVSKYADGVYQSLNLFPFQSGNINGRGSGHYRGTCTGGQSASEFKSLYVLNDMNINSMHHSYCIPPDWEKFVLACQVSSITLLRGEVDGKKQEQSESNPQPEQKQGEEDEHNWFQPNENNDLSSIPF